MFEVIAIAVAVQVSVNWVTHVLSPSAPSEVQHIEVNVDADELMCSTSETHVQESKVLNSRYKLQGLSTYDIIELIEYDDIKVDKPSTDIDLDGTVEQPTIDDNITLPITITQPTTPTVPAPTVPSSPSEPEQSPIDPRVLIW